MFIPNRPSEFPTAALHQHLLLEVFEFSHNGSQPAAVGFLSPKTMYLVEGDGFSSLCGKFQVLCYEVRYRLHWVFFCLTTLSLRGKYNGLQDTESASRSREQ